MGSISVDQNVPIILVIEDDDAIQTVVEDALSDAGFEPAIAPSGEEADGSRAASIDLPAPGEPIMRIWWTIK